MTATTNSQFSIFPVGPTPVLCEQTYSGTADGPRLTTLLEAVKTLLADGRWYTLEELHAALGRGSEAGISARLREARTRQGGSCVIERRRRGEAKRGLWEYRRI